MEENKEEFIENENKSTEDKKDIEVTTEQGKEVVKEDVVQDEIAEKEEKEILVEEPDEINEEPEKEKNKNPKKKIFIISILIIFLLFISTIFAIVNMNNTNIISGVKVEGIDISKMSKEEAENVINDKIQVILKRDITLKLDEYTTTITPEQIEMKFDYADALNKAQNIAKTNNILIDNYQILTTNILKTNINMQITYNKEILSDMIKNINLEIPGAVKQVTYEINDNKLIITNGKSGIEVQEDKLEEKIIGNVKDQLKDVINDIKIPTKEVEAEKIDIEKIHDEIYREAKDAYIEEDPFKLHVEENGLDFNISMEEAKKIVKEEKEEYEIPLKITKPKVRTKDLGDKIFKQTLSKYTTIYDAGNTSRASNIALACKTINETIIQPGETFSYNKVLGNTTKEKGYKLGGAYVGGKVVQAYGGGICQVSTTLYNSVLYANLEIVERYNHSYAVSYVPAGRDATVSYGGKDFKFKNNRNYPIKIVANAKNGVVNISLKGIKEDKEYDIEISSSVLSTTPFETTYQDNNTLAEGKQKIIQKGHNGYKSKAYKIVKYNGKVISKTLLSSDTYKPMNRIIEKGTKKNSSKSSDETTSKSNEKIEEAEVTENED